MTMNRVKAATIALLGPGGNGESRARGPVPARSAPPRPSTARPPRPGAAPPRPPGATIRIGLSFCAEARAHKQDVVVGVTSRHHLRCGRAQWARSVHLLSPGILLGKGKPVGSDPEAVGGAGGA